MKAFAVYTAAMRNRFVEAIPEMLAYKLAIVNASEQYNGLYWWTYDIGILESTSIAAKEFLPILLAGIVWGKAWHGCTIRCNCDNEAVVQVINGRYARYPLLAHMLRCLFFICARHQFTLVAKHIPGKNNEAADAISRNNLPLFYSQVPNAMGSPHTNSTTGSGGAGLQPSRLAVERLDQLVQFYFKQALAPATTRSYESAKKRYLAFCATIQSGPIPVTEARLLHFVAALAAEGLTYTTIKCYLSGIRHLQLSYGMGDPKVGNMATLQHVLRGIRSTQSRRGQQPRPRLPITPTILAKLRQVWERARHDHNNIMLWAACTTCFFGFLRSGEIAAPTARTFDPTSHLTVHNITVDNASRPQVVRVHIKASKTDPFRKGVHVFLGRTEDPLCPVAALLAYMAIRGRAPGPLFIMAH